MTTPLYLRSKITFIPDSLVPTFSMSTSTSKVRNFLSDNSATIVLILVVVGLIAMACSIGQGFDKSTL